MCIVGKDELLKLVHEYSVIKPFNPSQLDGDGYILTVERTETLNYLEHKNLISHEIVFTPPSYVAYLTAKSKFGRMGLSFLNAAKVHSGFVGRLALELVNLSNDRKPITIRKGDPLIHIEFITRLGKPSPYDGRYMFQYMDDEEVEFYLRLLPEKFPEVFDIDKLRERSRNREDRNMKVTL
ncbi:MAG TPA: hypothetical protein ENF41_00425 [Candidatus Bathyarchaeota archaeon]|nr:hypothetical protein [Candidatus Bathyarchaeota archaeon]